MMCWVSYNAIMEKETSNNVTVSLSFGTVVKTLLLLFGIYFVYLFRDLVVLILTAVVFASAIEPLTLSLCKLRLPRIVSVIIIYISFAIVCIGIMYTVVPTLVDETYKIQQSYDLDVYIPELPELYEEGDLFGNAEDVDISIENEVGKSVSFRNLIGDIQDKLSNDPGEVFKVISTIFGGVLSLILIFVISFYLAVKERGIEEFLEIIVPIRYRDYSVDLWKRSQFKIGRWMQGQLLLVLIVGVCVYILLKILGVPYALSLGLLAGFAELIPIFGPILAAIPAMIVVYSSGIIFASPGFASVITIVAMYLFIQQIENHLIYPWVVRKVVGISPLVVIFSLIIGGTLAGVLGVILAVPVAAVLKEFAEDVQKDKFSFTSQKNDKK